VSESTELLAALQRAIGNVSEVTRSHTAQTGSYAYTYATIGDVLREVRRVCTPEGLAVMQHVSTDDTRLAVTTVIVHSSGQTMPMSTVTWPMPRDPQTMGGIITYLRRYSLVSIFSIATEDDDGAAASRALAQQSRPPARQQATQPANRSQRSRPPAPPAGEPTPAADDEPTPPADPATAEQLDTIAALGDALALTPSQRRVQVSRLIGRTVATARDLSRAEAAKVVDGLLALQEQRTES
jgi:hypothetical protein